jgi:hypothetical protein
MDKNKKLLEEVNRYHEQLMLATVCQSQRTPQVSGTLAASIFLDKSLTGTPKANKHFMLSCSPNRRLDFENQIEERYKRGRVTQQQSLH